MSKKNAKAPLGASLIVISSFFYASYGIWTKRTGSFISGYPATAIRSVIVLMVLIPIALKLKKLQKLNLKKNWHLIVSLFVSSAMVWGPLYYAVLHAGVGVSLAVSYAGIVLGMFVFGWLFFWERFTVDKAISSAFGLAGLGLIFIPGNSKFGLLALMAAGLSGLGSSLNMTISKKLSYNATQSTIVLWSTGLISNTVMAFVVHEQLPQLVWNVAWLYLLVFGLASVVASWSFIAGLKHIDAGAAGILGLLEIVFGIAFGVVLFHEQPGFWVYAGSGVIMMAAAIPYIRSFDLKRGQLK